MTAIIRKILFSLIALILTLDASAQNEIKQAINAIKRSPDYFYAESTMPDESQARDAANVLLAQFINDYVKDNSISGVARVSTTDLKGVEYKSMARGAQTRVFAYVKRSVYLPKYGESQNIDKDISTKQTVSEIKETAETPIVTTKPTVKVVSEELSQIGRRAVGELLAATDLPSAVKYLAKLQSENIVKHYGTIRDCHDAVGSCWIIAQRNSTMEIVTILGPGNESRTNFKTNGDDTLANYSGYNAVWFELN